MRLRITEKTTGEVIHTQNFDSYEHYEQVRSVAIYPHYPQEHYSYELTAQTDVPMMDRLLVLQSDAMIRLAYFSNNYMDGWIEKCWGKNDYLTQHFDAKFTEYYLKYGSTLSFWKFYMDLSEDNKGRLNHFILTNYNHKLS